MSLSLEFLKMFWGLIMEKLINIFLMILVTKNINKILYLVFVDFSSLLPTKTLL